MAKWKTGKELLDEYEIRDFELFHSYIKKGLQPHNDLGDPLSPMEVLVEALEMEQMIDKASIMTEEDDEAKALEAKIKKATKAISASKEQAWDDFELPKSPGKAKPILSKLSGSLYRDSEFKRTAKLAGKNLASVKAKAPKEKKLRHSQEQRIRCREVAKKIWEKDQSITIVAMIKREEFIDITKKRTGEYYEDRTIHDWIKDLCPNRKPGRRPGT